MLRVGICDDEAMQREALRLALQRQVDEDVTELVIYDFSSGEGVAAWLQKHPGELDLLFLDYEMGGMTGLETARAIRKTDSRLLLVFLTGYADHVFDGYEVQALDYLLKPLNEDRLAALLKRVFGALQLQAPESYTLQNTEGAFRVAKADILYFYSEKRRVFLVTEQREYPFYGKLDEVAQEMGKAFVRIHNRYLVRAAAVNRVAGDEVQLGARVLPVSRACRKEALLALNDALLGGEVRP